jgi:hypothetical protein
VYQLLPLRSLLHGRKSSLNKFDFLLIYRLLLLFFTSFVSAKEDGDPLLKISVTQLIFNNVDQANSLNWMVVILSNSAVTVEDQFS